ncbi:leucine-rich repeat and WD repeat-containing protein 1 isoform X2 [Oryzias melastigma]|uniref:leucine-rich repeat and WD repeat-containing protein 1 isoform X2 n=1 Tax=Oryzias melastigma TaxID=30732 RepID=UPI000CF808AB|nr:leucine-rich repeat and WD repeat-containing protein 1 isoform X2 [Oryzias melastigma]
MMEKITEKLLLEKGTPKTNKLEQIKTLNLSKLGLQLQDLPVKLLSRLQSLERLDLSGNRLQKFPKNLELPVLSFLDLSDNQMEDVTTLESLSALKELKMDDNLYITVSDNYKLMVLLPNLRIYNGKDISTNANHLRFVYSDNLRSRIVAVWEKNFRLPDPASAEKLSDLETKFVSAACKQVKFGPSSVSEFTRWRVGILAKEYLHSLTEPEEDSESKESDTEEKEVVKTPSKRKPQPDVDISPRLTPRKRLRADPPNSPAGESPRKSSLRLRPHTQSQTGSFPAKTNGSASTPTRASRTNPKERSGKKDGRASLETDCYTMPLFKTSSRIQHPVSLKPLHVLQCHSKQDSSEDFSTQLWACAFQPQLDSSDGGGGSCLVATCGGDSVCVIDCETGMVMKKYKVPGEEFFSLAWSTVMMSRGPKASAQSCAVLAAGGKRGIVKLIHPRNNVAYGEFRASRKALSVLRFNQQKENFLFTGSYDNKIVMWDIGGIDSQYNFKVVQLLSLESSTTPLHIVLPPSSNPRLLSACEDGLFCYNTQLGTSSSTKRSMDMEITFPIYDEEEEDLEYHTVDGMSFLDDDLVASKNYTHSCIYLWSWSKTVAQRPDKKNRTVCAVILAELQWAKTKIPYLALNTCPGRGYIVCGDDKGRIWTYHAANLQKKGYKPGKPILPTDVLEWPAPTRKGLGSLEGPSINTVAMDPELSYMVALSDKNMVIIWKREESA